MQFARGPRRKDDFSGPPDRNVPRPRRTVYRMQITGLQPDTSWQVRHFLLYTLIVRVMVIDVSTVLSGTALTALASTLCRVVAY